jgi:hypothetical protein
MWARDLAGRWIMGERPFEQPWMARYIDKKLEVDSSRTWRMLNWEPRNRLDLIKRLPFLIENFKTNPLEWLYRNRQAMKIPHQQPNLLIYHALERHESDIRQGFHQLLASNEGQTHLKHYQNVSHEEHSWHHRLFLRNLMTSIRTRGRGVFITYCRDLAERRFQQGYHSEELCYALSSLDRICCEALLSDPETREMEQEIRDSVTITITFGIDTVHETFELLSSGMSIDASPRIKPHNSLPAEFFTGSRSSRDVQKQEISK